MDECIRPWSPEWSPLLEAALGAWEFAAAAVLERERSVGHLEHLAAQVEQELASEGLEVSDDMARAYTRPLFSST